MQVAPIEARQLDAAFCAMSKAKVQGLSGGGIAPHGTRGIAPQTASVGGQGALLPSELWARCKGRVARKQTPSGLYQDTDFYPFVLKQRVG